MDWELEISLHYPHDRFMLGWECLQPTEKFNYRTINLYLFFINRSVRYHWNRSMCRWHNGCRAGVRGGEEGGAIFYIYLVLRLAVRRCSVLSLSGMLYIIWLYGLRVQ